MALPPQLPGSSFLSGSWEVASKYLGLEEGSKQTWPGSNESARLCSAVSYLTLSTLLQEAETV